MEFLIGLICGFFIGLEIMTYGIRIFAKDNPPDKVIRLLRDGTE